MTYKEFLEKTFPDKNPFNRKNKSILHNTIKFFALLFSYICFKLRISANQLDFIGFIILIFAFILISNTFILSETRYDLIIIGYLLIGFVLFIDFVDGQLARIDNKKYIFGNNIDDFNPDLIRIFLVMYPGILSQNFYIFLFCSISIITFRILYNEVFKVFEKKFPNFIKIIRFLFGIRILYLFLFPLFTFILYFKLEISLLIMFITSVIYFLTALIFYFLCSKITK